MFSSSTSSALVVLENTKIGLKVHLHNVHASLNVGALALTDDAGLSPSVFISIPHSLALPRLTARLALSSSMINRVSDGAVSHV